MMVASTSTTMNVQRPLKKLVHSTAIWSMDSDTFSNRYLLELTSSYLRYDSVYLTCSKKLTGSQLST